LANRRALAAILFGGAQVQPKIAQIADRLARDEQAALPAGRVPVAHIERAPRFVPAEKLAERVVEPAPGVVQRAQEIVAARVAHVIAQLLEGAGYGGGQTRLKRLHIRYCCQPASHARLGSGELAGRRLALHLPAHSLDARIAVAG
jgi:hypothetical protein